MSQRNAGRRGTADRPDAGDHFDQAPARIATRDDLVAAIDALRRRSPDGTPRQRVTLAAIAAESGIPISTVHSYLSGRSLPPPEALDAMVWVLGADGPGRRTWADALERVQAASRRAPGRAAPRTLAPPVRDFVGRVQSLAEMTRAWRQGAGRSPLLLLTGAAGIGKTSLALEWANRHTDSFPEGALQIDLGGFGQGAPVGATRAQRRLLIALGVAAHDLPSDPDELSALYHQQLSARTLVLVLDNARNSHGVAPLLTGAPHVTTVITSRDAMRGLAVAQGVTPIEVPLMDAEEAGVLLARASSRSLGPKQVDRATKACGGLPLALRLAADTLLTDVPDAASGLLDSLSLDDDGTVVGVRSVIASSVGALGASARQLFVDLGTIPGRWLAPETVRVVARQPVSALDELVTLHLLDDRDGGWARHDLITQVAAELADAEPSSTSHRLAVLDHYVRTAASMLGSAVHLASPLGVLQLPVEGFDADSVTWVDEHEFDAMLAMAGWALDHEVFHACAALLDLLTLYACDRGGFDELRAPLERLANDDRVPAEVRSAAMQALARGCRHSGEPEAELTWFARAHEVSVDLPDDHPMRMALLVTHGSTLTFAGHANEGVPMLRRALELARTAGSHVTQSLIENDLGVRMLQQGRIDEGLRLLAASADSAERGGAPGLIVLPLLNAALAAVRTYATTRDVAWLDRAEPLLARAESRQAQSAAGERLYALMCHAQYSAMRGDHERALDLARQVSVAAEQSQDAWNQRTAHQVWGVVLAEAGRHAEAAAHHEAARTASLAQHDEAAAFESLVALAELAVVVGDRARARELCVQIEIESSDLDPANHPELTALRARLDAEPAPSASQA